MADKRKGSQQDRQSIDRDKDMNNLHIYQKIKNLLLSGGRYTAAELNYICGGNDARKIISNLRNKELMNIRDIRLEDGRKLYWYSPIDREGGKL